MLNNKYYNKNQLILLFLGILLSIPSFAESTKIEGSLLQTIKQRNYLICGVSQGLAGFSSIDDKGQWHGMDVDFCKAVAAAVLGDATKVKFSPLSAEERFTALQSGEVDLLVRNTTWTYDRDTALGISFVGVLYYDGQKIMVPKASPAKHILDLNNATICTNRGTTTELNIADYFNDHKIKYKIITFEKSDETLAAYETGRCDAYSTDASGLAAQKLKLASPNAHWVLGEAISKEPLSIAVRQNDNHWEKIVKWVLFAMINAEEMQIKQTNVENSANDKNQNAQIRRFLGKEGHIGENVALSNDWIYQVIFQVGNYEDVFNRNVGSGSPLQLERGINALWNKGGILYAPPFR